MRFFRVSHTHVTNYNGEFVGPYIGDHDCCEDPYDDCPVYRMAFDHSGVDTHPSPFRDSMASHVWKEWDDWFCGFESIEKLADWFDGWFGNLTDCGYVIREYEVPDEDVVIGHRQSVIKGSTLAGLEEISVRRLTSNLAAA